MRHLLTVGICMACCSANAIAAEKVENLARADFSTADLVFPVDVTHPGTVTIHDNAVTVTMVDGDLTSSTTMPVRNLSAMVGNPLPGLTRKCELSGEITGLWTDGIFWLVIEDGKTTHQFRFDVELFPVDDETGEAARPGNEGSAQEPQSCEGGSCSCSSTACPANNGQPGATACCPAADRPTCQCTSQGCHATCVPRKNVAEMTFNGYQTEAQAEAATD